MPQPASPLRPIWAFALLCGLLLFPAPSAQCADFQGLGQLPGAAVNTSEAWSVSADGSVVVGHAINSLGNYEAFIWSGGALSSLSALGPGGESFAWGVSADGSTVVGRYDSGAGFPEAFLWTAGGGYTMLGIMAGGTQSLANAVNADGTVVVGMSESAAGYEAFRWTAGGGMVSLGDLPGGGTDSKANGVSADGTVVVGRGLVGPNYEAFRWTAGTGMVSLGTLEGVGDSEALGVSSDGTTIVGCSEVAAGGGLAFRWTVGTGMVSLGSLAGSSSSVAYAVNADGSVIVGAVSRGATNEAFLWTQSGGMVSLAQYLQSRGVNLTGWDLDTATAVNADGTTIVGSAYNPDGDTEAFVARTSGGFSTMEALADSLRAMAGLTNRVAVTGLSRVRTMIQAAPGGPFVRPAGLSGGDEAQVRRRFWTAGTVLSDSSLSGSDLGAEGGAGLTWTWDNGLSAGAGMFTGRRVTDTDHGGSQDLVLTGPAAYVGYTPGVAGLRAEAGAVYTLVDMDLDRGYMNGSGSATSHGQTQGRMFSLAGRLGWLFPVTEQVGLEPFVMHSWQILDVDGYTESDGPFPARFSSRQDMANITRTGLEATYAWTPATDLWTWAAWSHRWEDEAGGMGGTLLGLSDFRFGTVRVDQDWGDTGVGVKHRPWQGFEVFSRVSAGIDSQDNAEPGLATTIGFAWDI